MKNNSRNSKSCKHQPKKESASLWRQYPTSILRCPSCQILTEAKHRLLSYFLWNQINANKNFQYNLKEQNKLHNPTKFQVSIRKNKRVINDLLRFGELFSYFPGNEGEGRGRWKYLQPVVRILTDSTQEHPFNSCVIFQVTWQTKWRVAVCSTDQKQVLRE